MEIFFLFIICVGGCWLVFKAIGVALFGKSKKDQFTFIDKSVHYHLHDNKQAHQHIHIIDDTTKKKILELKKTKPTN
ncbi:hypothetical protein LPBF_03090 [Flavobacterium crassostreae]|uniref:Uncharacterized protein n=1 Tax=Flavobacterium crassostreae TaxID=1763534 RepID=A0A1B9E7M3_9FLAO|nr:hypothetical protein LPBF_03090 [Flavobacterium crassostreae]